MNAPMGPKGLTNLWNDICEDFNVPKCTIYALRQTLGTSYVKNGCDLFEAAVVTKHRSIRALGRYQHDREKEKRTTSIVQNYMKSHIDKSTNAYTQHVKRVMNNTNNKNNHGNNDNDDWRSNYINTNNKDANNNGNNKNNNNNNGKHSQNYNDDEKNVNENVIIDTSTLPQLTPIQLPDLSQVLASIAQSSNANAQSSAVIAKTSRYKPVRGVSNACFQTRNSPIAKFGNDKEEND